jgi:hypothetical protein
MELIKSYDAPTPVYSASLHPNKSCYVVGGEDCKLYKFDYETGSELGKKIIIYTLLRPSTKCLKTQDNMQHFM